MVEDNYTVHGYSQNEMRKNQEVNAFEYLFGLGKYLSDKFDILHFNTKISDDEVNPIAFELVNACLNDSDKIKLLYKNVYSLDINSFEKALIKAIVFVSESIAVITKFKGNIHKNNKPFHAKYQILSMISTSFKEMFDDGNYLEVSPNWCNKKISISKNLVQYYVYDIITNYWSEGGTSKIHSAAKPNRYLEKITGRAWAVALDSFFEKSMRRVEVTKVANPGDEEYVLLNCIYLKSFTAMDQLSLEKFDVEHIATKEQMKQHIKACKGTSLPISCISNLCYLPEYVNRSKGKKNSYQDKKYLQKVSLEEIEKKYSFTKPEDLEWMDMPYEKAEDFSVLKEYYTEFCVKRFEVMKRLFCDSLQIEYVDSTEDNDSHLLVEPTDDANNIPQKFSDKCVKKLAVKLNTPLIKLRRGVYSSEDNKNLYAISTSKMYVQGKREKYWFAYRPQDNFDNFSNQFYVFGCKNEHTMIVIPKEKI